jgi:nucleoside-diphosphate-sugar epimerase
MRIMVTGGAGYVGSALCPILRDRGHEVLVVDLGIFGQSPDKFPLIVGDIDSLEDEVIERFDAIIHLAGLSNDPMAHFSPLANFRVNTASAIYLAYRAKNLGVKKFILASSASVYQGITNAAWAIPINPILRLSEPYAISKLMAERGCTALADGDFTVVALRKGTIGGPSPRMRYDLMVNTMFKSAIVNGYLEVFTDREGGSVYRPHLDIRDAVEAYVRAVELSKSGIYNVASEIVRVSKVARSISQATECEVRHTIVSDPTLLRNYVMGQIGGGHTISETVTDLVERAPRDFDNPSYINIDVWRSHERCNSRR